VKAQVTRNYGWKITGCIVAGMPLAAAGLMLCATIVFSPIGVLFLVMSGVPLAMLQTNHLRRKREWSQRDRPLPNDAVPPWYMTETIDELEPDA
jgi:hypothetical protein